MRQDASARNDHRDRPRTRETVSVALTVAEASSLLRLDPRTVRAMLQSGEIEGNRRGHAIRILRASVMKWLEGKRGGATR